MKTWTSVMGLDNEIDGVIVMKLMVEGVENGGKWVKWLNW